MNASHERPHANGANDHELDHEHDHEHGHGHGDRRPRSVERHCDVAIVGGSAAGLAAALQLARQRRSVIVVDAGEPRNAPADHMHGYLGREGASPSELIRIGRQEVRSFGVEVLDGRVEGVERAGADGFRLALVGGHAIVARRVVAATGLVDELPAIDGLAERWGSEVVHCPFCHGYEVRDRRIVQVLTHPMGLHPTVLWAQLAAQFTLVVHGATDVPAAELEAVAARGVDVVVGTVRRVTGGGHAAAMTVEIDGRDPLVADVVAVGPRFRVRAEPFEPLGLRATAHPSGLGDHLATDATGQTGVPGVYAAGNATDPSHQVLHAAADGSRVGAMIAFDLAREGADGRGSPADTGPAPSANAVDWDRRYGGDQLWSGNPNGSLVREVDQLAPGRAIDVGAGEGGDAIWLAEHGWHVVASDISSAGLARTAAAAERRGLTVECRRVDANAPGALGAERFDLVTAMYASIPRTPDGRAVENLKAAVAPGGVLLVVGHDLEPMRVPVDTSVASRMFDPDAYVRVDDVAAALVDDSGWAIEVHERRTRPAGAASSAHHVDDVVLRARRREITRSGS